MRLLYAGFDELLKKAETLVPALTDLPIISETKITSIYLGSVPDLVPLEVKADKKTLGWLYNKSSIIFFRYEGQLYEVFAACLRVAAEEQFKAKKILKEDEEPFDGSLRWEASGKITGYLSIGTILEVSNKITDDDR